MARAIRYHLLFNCDVIEAANWYDRRSNGLGDAFCDAVRSAVDAILLDPNRHPEIEDGVRYRRVQRFPYLVLFELTDFEIALLTVVHTSQSPDRWRGRRA